MSLNRQGQKGTRVCREDWTLTRSTDHEPIVIEENVEYLYTEMCEQYNGTYMACENSFLKNSILGKTEVMVIC